jgi:hypothetical protein
MNLAELSASKLRQAAALKERIEQLQKELNSILGNAPTAAAAPAQPKLQAMSAGAKAKLSARMKEIWAKRKGAKPAPPAGKRAQPKSKMSPAAKAALSAKLKAYWAKKKAAKK